MKLEKGIVTPNSAKKTSILSLGRPLFSLTVFVCFSAHAQEAEPPKVVPKVVPVPPLRRTAPLKDPTDPPARDVADPRDHLTFHLPAAWNLATRDGELSTFRLDARTAPARSQLHIVAALAFNPYPQSTFSSALFYISSTPHLTPEACVAQTSTKPFAMLSPDTIDGISFARGKDEHGKICTESRDVANTAMRNGSCLRVDLAINTFCGGDVSGAQELTEGQLGGLYKRLHDILETIHFTK